MSDRGITYKDLGLEPKLGLRNTTRKPPTPSSRPQIKININRNTVLPHTQPAVRRALRTFHKFLELPLEMRRHIYNFAFMPKTGVIGSRALRVIDVQVYRDAQWREDRRNQRALVAVGLLQTNHQVYHEALEYLYRSKNTIIITSPNMLEHFFALPRPLESCASLNCLHSSLAPIIHNGVWYPKEMDYALSHRTFSLFPSRIMDSMLAYLPDLAKKGQITFSNLTLDISHENPDLDGFREAMCTANLHILSRFTIRCWSFVHNLRVWLCSADLKDVLEHMGLQEEPVYVQELPQNMIGERRSWEVRWEVKKPVGAWSGVDHEEQDTKMIDAPDATNGTDAEDSEGSVEGPQRWWSGQAWVEIEADSSLIPDTELDLGKIFERNIVVRKRIGD